MKDIPTSALLQELLARVRAREGTATVSPREWDIVYMAIGPLRFRQQDNKSIYDASQSWWPNASN